MNHPDAPQASPPIRVERCGALGRITLDRPKSYNAVNPTMARAILAVLEQWRDDPDVSTVMLDGGTPRAFCAGGDIKHVRAIIEQAGPEAALAEMSVPYVTMLAIAAYPKPVVTMMDGITMGGGIGLGSHARHRIVTERSVLAMPETSIGLTPDAGGSWLMARAPGLHGLRLSLTGGRMSGRQAVEFGFADHFVDSDALSPLPQRLADSRPNDIDALLASLALPLTPTDAPTGPTAAEVAAVYDVPAHDLGAGLRTILTRLQDLVGPDGKRPVWAEQDLSALRAACPFSLHLTWAAWERLRSERGTLEQAFEQETRLVGALLKRHDFPEGVRARLIDKDNAPIWNPSSIDAVLDQDVQECFTNPAHKNKRV